MTHSVEDIARAIVRREGGYVNDPDDPGGATKHGVTIHTIRRLGLDLDGDGDVDADDVKLIDEDCAVEIFIRDYFRGPRIHLLPAGLQANVFDMQVNAGSQAVRLLQRGLVQFGEAVAVDGVIGPMTAGAAYRVADRIGVEVLSDYYAKQRRAFYYRLGDQRPPLRKFARRRDGGKGGWITRAEEFMSAKSHYTAAEHEARVSGWG